MSDATNIRRTDDMWPSQDTAENYPPNEYPQNLGTIVGAHGATLHLEDGTSVVDLASDSFCYGDTRIVRPVAEQLRRLPLSNRTFFSRPLAMLVQRLAEMSPGDLSVCYFCNSGTEALEGALKLARGYHRDRPLVVAAAASHASTLGTLSINAISPLRSRVVRLPMEAIIVDYGDLVALERAISRRVCALVLEPVSTSAGVRVPPPGYLRAAKRLCNRTGTLLIADEITTGLGRTGSLFAISRDDVTPDILVLGKALGGGVLPMGAYITTRMINDRVYGRRSPTLHGSTTGGNPAACVAGLATLMIVEHDGVAESSSQLGNHLDNALRELHRSQPATVGAHVSIGLLASIAVCTGSVGALIQKEARRQGVLVLLQGSPAGLAWLTLRPPLLISPTELERGLHALAIAVQDVAAANNPLGTSP